MGYGGKVRFILAVTPFRTAWPMNSQHLEHSAYRTCLRGGGDLEGLTKVTYEAVSRFPLFLWFSASSNSSHPLEAAMRPE